MSISLRSAKNTDYNFLWNLHKATMKNYVDAIWGWEEAFQKTYFADHFSTENTYIIESGKDVGMVRFRNDGEAFYIENLEIDPSVQNKGIGTAILKAIINTAASRHNTIKLHVLKVNPAKELYERLNFNVVAETKTHFLMERSSSI